MCWVECVRAFWKAEKNECPIIYTHIIQTIAEWSLVCACVYLWLHSQRRHCIGRHAHARTHARLGRLQLALYIIGNVNNHLFMNKYLKCIIAIIVFHMDTCCEHRIEKEKRKKMHEPNDDVGKSQPFDFTISNNKKRYLSIMYLSRYGFHVLCFLFLLLLKKSRVCRIENWMHRCEFYMHFKYQIIKNVELLCHSIRFAIVYFSINLLMKKIDKNNMLTSESMRVKLPMNKKKKETIQRRK